MPRKSNTPKIKNYEKIKNKQNNTNNNQSNQAKKVIYYNHGDYFDVERIVAHKTDANGNLLYCVKWVGWDEASNTWETLEFLKSVKELILEYETKFKVNYTKSEQNQRDEFFNDQSIIDILDINDMSEGNYQECYGSLRTDIPLKIKCLINKETLLIEWSTRLKTGIKPKDSCVEYKKFKRIYPDFLLDYYEQCLVNRK